MQVFGAQVLRRCLLAYGVLIASLMPTIAAAASFDCNGARTALEKTVCAEPKLSVEDSEMTQRYNKALSTLSAQGQVILRSGQKQWLNVITVLCLDHARKGGASECLRRQYEDRLNDLQTAAVWIGPFLFSRVDRYTSPGVNGATDTPLEQHVGLPRIDQPLSADAERWSAAIVRDAKDAQMHWCYGEFESADAKDPDTLSEQMLSFKVFARSGFINVKFTHYEQCGAGAANEDVRNVSYFLGPTLRPLAAGDVFSQGSHWMDFLADKAVSELASGDPDLADQRDFRDGIRKVVSNPSAWSFTEQGLVISFNPGYGNASIASGPVDVAISWEALRPFVKSTAPVPLD